MFSLTVNSIRANKVRFLLTGVAVILGVAFMAGTLVLTDTIKRSYTEVTASVYQHTDALVRSNRVIDAGDDVGKTRGTVVASTLAAVRNAPGVLAAEARQTGVAVLVGHDGKLVDANPNRSIPLAVAWQSTPQLNPMDLLTGRAPRAPDEVVIDRASQRKGRFQVGETVRVVGPTGTGSYRLVGIVRYAGHDDAAGAQVLAFTAETAAKVLGTAGRYTEIQVVAGRGVSQATLAANVEQALRSRGVRDVEVLTGAKAVAESKSDAAGQLAFFDIFLMTFAIVALVVGSFVIYNTFSITVAQRMRETALLRAIGASRRQVKRAIRLEALLTGVVASAIGVVIGIATAQGLRAVLSAFGVPLPDGDTVIGTGAIVVSSALGVVVTVVAAYLPARKASKVPPIAALRDVAIDRSAASTRRTVIGAVVTVLGAVLVALGLDGAGAPQVGIGALLVFVGVTVLGPAIARPFARLLGAPLARFRGMPGTLARENATRNPRRTASTASSLMIGAGLVVCITVFAASVKSSLAAQIDTATRSEWIVETQFGIGGLDPDVAHRIDALPETAAVTALRWTTAKIDGSADDLAAFDPAQSAQTMNLKVRSGDIRQLGTDGIAMYDKEARTRHLRLGDRVSLFFPETGAKTFRLVATYGIQQPLGSFAISRAAYDANVRDKTDKVLLVKNAPGVSIEQARTAINKVLADSPTAELRTKAEFSDSMAAQINQMLGLIYVLLGMAVVIALFGIANTLALSVFERTREIGLLRAVGASRAQVRSSVRWEAVLIAMLGTTLGLAIGLGFSWALVSAMKSEGFSEFTVPGGQLTVIMLFAAGAAVLTAVLPARRAARLDVLQAISA